MAFENNVILRTTTHAPYSTKNAELTWEELDANHIALADAILAMHTPSSGVAVYSNIKGYSSGDYVRYNDKLWRAIYDSTFADQTPAEGTYWTEASPGELMHVGGKDTVLDLGGANEVTAATLKAFVNTLSVSYSDFTAALTAGTLTRNRWYRISDRADDGIYVFVPTTKSASFSGFGVFLNADWGGVGDYSDVTTGNGFSATFDPDASPANTLLGLWNSGMEVLAGDIAIWNGLHWLNKTGTNSAQPQDDSTNWQQILPTVGSKFGYVIECDAIEYDFTNDWLISRADKRGNKIKLSKRTDDVWFSFGYNAPSRFQWGNTSWYGNVVEEGMIDALNFVGLIDSNRLSHSRIKNITGDGSGRISMNTLLKNSLISDVEFSSGDSNLLICSLSGSTISNKVLGNATISVTLEDVSWSDEIEIDDNVTGYANHLGSDLERSLDLNDGGVFAAGELAIPDGCEAYGVFVLTASADKTISKISGDAPRGVMRFRGQAGRSFQFNYTAVASLDNFKLIGVGASNTIVGSNKDWIDFESSYVAQVRFLKQIQNYS